MKLVLIGLGAVLIVAGIVALVRGKASKTSPAVAVGMIVAGAAAIGGAMFVISELGL
jgi:lipoprotein signal peptidase